MASDNATGTLRVASPNFYWTVSGQHVTSLLSFLFFLLFYLGTYLLFPAD
jgi:hypothetical protein